TTAGQRLVQTELPGCAFAREGRTPAVRFCAVRGRSTTCELHTPQTVLARCGLCLLATARSRRQPAPERWGEGPPAGAVTLHQLANVLRRDLGVARDQGHASRVPPELCQQIQALEGRERALAGDAERQVELAGRWPLRGRPAAEDEMRRLDR